MIAGMEAKLRPLLLDAEGVLSRLVALEGIIASRETEPPELAAHIRAARAGADHVVRQLATALQKLSPEKEDAHKLIDQRPQTTYHPENDPFWTCG